MLLTSRQMRALEDAAIAAGTVSGLRLMERAGRATLAAAFSHWPALAARPGRALVLCGPGNNGGDGFVIARRLAEAGWTLALSGPGVEAPPRGDAARMAKLCAGLGGMLPLSQVPGAAADADLVVDALFGTGLGRPVTGELAQALTGARAAPRVLAVDLPSGLCADSGRVLGQALRADLTVTFHAAKRGHYLGQGPSLCGALRVVDIGLPGGPAGSATEAPAAPPTRDGSTNEAAAVGSGGADVLRFTRPVPLTKGQGAKFDHGHAVQLAGGVGRGGAARMAARAALRVGAGLVTLGPPPAALIENAARLDAVMLHALRDAEALAGVLADPRITALGLGPGLGLGPREAALVGCALDWGGPLVLDADALTLIARDPALAARLHRDCVLTPHLGEFRRLFPDLAALLAQEALAGPAFSACDAVQAAAARTGCTVLLKGPATVIATPEGGLWLNDACYDNAAPDLATAGAGDVLAGLILGLLARGLPGEVAAGTGAWLHAACGRALGPGLIAEDLVEALPAVLPRLAREAGDTS